MSTATVASKRCVNCHKDVTSGKRMKDSSGRYWCLDCGRADQLKKGVGGEACGSCGEKFPASKLSKWGTQKLCNGCVKRREKGPGLMEGLKGGGSGSPDKGKLMMMLAIAAVLAAVSAMRFMHVF